MAARIFRSPAGVDRATRVPRRPSLVSQPASRRHQSGDADCDPKKQLDGDRCDAGDNHGTRRLCCRVDVAEKIAPNSGGVLVDRGTCAKLQAWQNEINRCWIRGPQYLTNTPSARGVPDYQKATLQWSNAIAIPAGGVGAIRAVLQNAPCVCEILYLRANATAYWIWIIPVSPPAPASKYVVDAKTFAVTPGNG
jgi:hypothetical protein